MKAGDRIRVQHYIMGRPAYHEDYTVEEFRYCLGIFLSENHRKSGDFTPLCELYEPHPDAEKGYIPNYGEYWSEYVPAWGDIPRDTAPTKAKALGGDDE